MLDMVLNKKLVIGGIDMTLNITERLIYSAMVFEVMKDASEPVAITYEEIGEIVGMSSKTVQRVIPEMIDIGILNALKRVGGRGQARHLFTGHPEIIVNGKKVKEKVLVEKKEIVVTPRLDNEHYTYICLHNNTPVYVGMGKGDRLNHCISGKSSSVGLNKLVASGESSNMVVKKIKTGLSQADARSSENSLILGYQAAGFELLNLQ